MIHQPKVVRTKPLYCMWELF